ncbi:hypothetical protein M758_1G174200 [Ceratodon purpureus]|nr:hypothetical protein M758_1G174200 [Ceratodon purpureus]KAG0630378.1 hypothetical protein M758_1G174200 [Ceratodon purpureus]KAG0630379.1 hypothetical protein M758_1G174200 [Ceratodon purpureus]
MGDHLKALENVESGDEPRVLLENPVTDDEYGSSDQDSESDHEEYSESDECSESDEEYSESDECSESDEEYSGSDVEYSAEEFALKVSQFDDWDKAFIERYLGQPYKHVLEGLFSVQQESSATQEAHVSGSRTIARRVLPMQPGNEMEPTESPLYGSCFKLLFEMTEGAYRVSCPDPMEYLADELNQVLYRQKVLIKVGKDAGYDSPSFQKAVVAWREALARMATDPVHAAEQSKYVSGAANFEKTLERLRNLQPEEAEPKTSFELPLENAEERSAHIKVKSAPKWKRSNLPSADVYRKDCERLTRELMCDAAYSRERPFLLLELLIEDLQHVQRRQQAFFRAELAAAMGPQTQKVERLPCDDLTRGFKGVHLSKGRESMNPIHAISVVPNPTSGARSPFSTNQLVEFKQQAEIFKHMKAGVHMNVSNEILDPIRKSVASMNGIASPHAANSFAVDLGAFHPGVVNTTDTEPNRCRRSDGKKWRCARNVVPGQKHCERHMYRGRQRSSLATSTSAHY